MKTEKTYNFVYKTTCTVTNKFYIGVHSGWELDEWYLGSGLILGHSVTKYGEDKHVREVLFNFDTRDEAFEKEKELISEFLHHPLCMNIVPGGRGGKPEGIKCSEQAKKNIGIANSKIMLKLWQDEDFRKKRIENISKSLKDKPLSTEARKAMSEAALKRRKKTPEEIEKHREMIRGSMLVHSDDLKKNIRIRKEDKEKYLAMGYKNGTKSEYTQGAKRKKLQPIHEENNSNLATDKF